MRQRFLRCRILTERWWVARHWMLGSLQRSLLLRDLDVPVIFWCVGSRVCVKKNTHPHRHLLLNEQSEKTMSQLLLILHILLAISIVALVLLQHGRGADMGASFGSGASNTILGSSGTVPFLMKVTAI